MSEYYVERPCDDRDALMLENEEIGVMECIGDVPEQIIKRWATFAQQHPAAKKTLEYGSFEVCWLRTDEEPTDRFIAEACSPFTRDQLTIKAPHEHAESGWIITPKPPIWVMIAHIYAEDAEHGDAGTEEGA